MTIKEVAEAAGVHYSTVSLALRGDPRVSAGTVEAVRREATRLGYVRNAAFALMGSRSRGAEHHAGGLPIAVVRQRSLEGKRQVTVSNREAMRKRCAELGYACSEHWLDEHPSVGALTRMLSARGVVGVVFDFIHDDAVVRHPGWAEFALVARNVVDRALPVDTVRTDNFAAVIGALRRMHQAGHRRIGVICEQRARASDEDLATRGAAYAGLAELGCAPRVLSCAHGDLAAMTAWVETEKPGALLVRTGSTLTGLIERGVRLPAAVSMITRESLHLPYAGMVKDNHRIVAACIEWLDMSLRHGRTGLPKAPESWVVEPVWRDEASLSRRERNEE